MVGFFGKLYLFTSAVQADLLWPVLVAVAMSVVSAGYYFKVLRAIFFGRRDDAPQLTRSIPAALALGVSTVVVLALGVFASPVLSFLGIGF
jgi:NADH-quinone oxidoreductase subunit N